jgi:hypothetical protein
MTAKPSADSDTKASAEDDAGVSRVTGVWSGSLFITFRHFAASMTASSRRRPAIPNRPRLAGLEQLIDKNGYVL